MTGAGAYEQKSHIVVCPPPLHKAVDQLEQSLAADDASEIQNDDLTVRKSKTRSNGESCIVARKFFGCLDAAWLNNVMLVREGFRTNALELCSQSPELSTLIKDKIEASQSTSKTSSSSRSACVPHVAPRGPTTCRDANGPPEPPRETSSSRKIEGQDRVETDVTMKRAHSSATKGDSGSVGPEWLKELGSDGICRTVHADTSPNLERRCDCEWSPTIAQCQESGRIGPRAHHFDVIDQTL